MEWNGWILAAKADYRRPGIGIGLEGDLVIQPPTHLECSQSASFRTTPREWAGASKMKKLSLWTYCAVIGLLTLIQFPSCAEQTNDPQDNVSELVGSRWRLTYDSPNFGHREYDLIFREAGKLINTHPNEKTPDNDTWEARGNKIELRFNNGYAVYRGEFSDPNHMSGTSTSKAGGTWKWQAHRLDK